MKKFFIFCFIIILSIFSSCKTKENCEMLHTGDICITNKNTVAVEVFINGINKGSVEANKNITITQPVGNYMLKIKNGIQIKEYSDIVVSECSQTNLSVNFYE